MKLLATTAALALLVGMGSAASAATVITITGTFDGSLDGTAFTGSSATFTGQADDGLADGPSVRYQISSLSALINIDGNDVGFTFDNPATLDNVFGGTFYDLNTEHHLLNFSPAFGFLSGSDLPSATDGGPFSITSGSNISISFEAQGGGGGGVPEPASWALMLGGFGAIGATLRRREKVSVSFS